LLIAEVSCLESRLQISQSLADASKALMRRAVYIWMSSYFVKSLLECGLDPLDLAVDLGQPAKLRVFGDRCGQPVSFLSI
jgi:hypothetical protein